MIRYKVSIHSFESYKLEDLREVYVGDFLLSAKSPQGLFQRIARMFPQVSRVQILARNSGSSAGGKNE